MSDPNLTNAVQRHREDRGLSQRALAERVGVTRQTILGIEAGRQVPSTTLALLLARTLGCRVDDLFGLPPREAVPVRLAPGPADEAAPGARAGRVTLGAVDGSWVAHGPVDAAREACDGILVGTGPGGTASVRPLCDPDEVERNVLVAGCAPLLGLLAQRVARRHVDARATWIEATSRRALELLAGGLIHVAGVHLFRPGVEPAADATIRRIVPGQPLAVVNLTRWRQGIVVPAGNPAGVRSAADLVRPGLRVAIRDQGSVADALVRRLATQEGVRHLTMEGPRAGGHEDVARLVRCGAADAGVAIENVALAAGLGFLPLAEERFDLVVPTARMSAEPVSRLFDVIAEQAFRLETSCLPGYDGTLTGRVTTLDAA